MASGQNPASRLLLSPLVTRASRQSTPAAGRSQALLWSGHLEMNRHLAQREKEITDVAERVSFMIRRRNSLAFCSIVYI